jgi:hypothetical protein
MANDSALQKGLADLLPFEDDSAAPGQVPVVLGYCQVLNAGWDRLTRM